MQQNTLLLDQPATPACYTPSSLSIPDHFLEFFTVRCKQYGGRKQYFSYIISNILMDLETENPGLQSSNDSWKTQYQKKGQNLSKKTFLPVPDDWEALRQLAWALGVSMCFLFVYMLKLDYDSTQKNNPTQKNSDDRKTLPPRSGISPAQGVGVLVRCFNFEDRIQTRIHHRIQS